MICYTLKDSMSKIGKTKKDILKILSKKQQTITDVSHILNLSPSTVKQHFDELVRMGAIVQVENEFIKRWKYYKTTPSFNIDNFKKEKTMANVIPYAIGSIIVIALIGFLFYSNMGINTNGSVISNPSAYSLTVQLTDPPHVPANTTALILNYTSISVNTLSPNDTQSWVNISSSGSVDLMSLINTSEILGNIKLKSGYKLEGVVLNAKNANIIIGNQTYPVIMLNNKVYATVPQNSFINSNSSVLIDFSPTVSNIYTNNATVFIMTPSVKAVFYNNYKDSTDVKNGVRQTLTPVESKSLLTQNLNLSILSSNILQNNNSTSIQITLKNNGNKTIDIKQIMLSGQITSHILLNNKSEIFIHDVGLNNNINVTIHKLNFNNNGQDQIIVKTIKTKGINSSITQNTSIESMPVQVLGIKQYSFSQMEIPNNVQINVPTVVSDVQSKIIQQRYINNDVSEVVISRFNLSNSERENANMGLNMVFLRQLVFFVNKNASLEIPQFSSYANGNEASIGNFIKNNTGYELSPGSTVTLTFNGNITCGNNFIKGELFDNSSYKITVIASNDISSQASVVANG